MIKPLLTFFLVFNILAAQAQNSIQPKSRLFTLPRDITVNDYVPGVVIVKFKEAVGSSAKTRTLGLPGTLKSKSVLSLKKVFTEAASSVKTSARRQNDAGLSRIYELQVNRASNIETVINELLTDRQVEYAEPRYIHHTNLIPNDPRFPQQGYFQQVMAPQAWDLIGPGSVPSVIIAIVDSGSELTHPDLAANIYYNAAENPSNGLDDDGNGKVDDFRGWDFAGNSGNSEDNNPNVVGPANDHGVHVSGIAAAVTNNGVGVASIAFNTAKLLIVKTGPDNSGTDILYGYEGIKYAADMGANIINCSWGSTSGGSFGRDIVNYAISKGCLIVAAGGNSGGTKAEYPAAFPGVLAVANVASNNEKAGSSNYGNYISISAPGNSILSSTFNATYGTSTGTSMSAPVVSSTAALVKAYRPGLSMQQVGELVRVTADDVYNVNSEYPWQLGKGRVNVFKALTQTPPSVRIARFTQQEINSANNTDADTLYLFLDLKNFLYPVTNLSLTLNSSNPNVTVLTPQISLPALGTLETASQVGPFKVAILPGSPSNLKVDFRLNYANNANSYQDFEHLTVVVAKDQLDISNGTITTSIASNGRIGFSAPEQEEGQGFVYKGRQMLYEAALMIGNSPTRVSNSARGINDETDEHFVKIVSAHQVVNNADSIVAESEFDDRANPNRLNVAVKHRIIVYKNAPNTNYAIAEFEIFNRGTTTLGNVHVGLFTDWDIGDGLNITKYDPASRLGYVYSKDPAEPYAAVKLLNQDAPPVYYPLSSGIEGNPLSDQEFSLADKWETLSSGVKSFGIGATTDGVDVYFTSGYGPYFIPANSSIRVAFAFIGGENLENIQTTALAAQQKYELINPGGTQKITDFDLQVYPNPIVTNAEAVSNIRFTLPEAGQVSLELYNLTGQRVKTLISNKTYGRGIHFFRDNLSEGYSNDVRSGVYFYRMKYNGESKSRKIIIQRD
ncbi:MAG: S8 family serine peptidase [Sphingobacteriaceae bacterium]|nr:S8 family serine peptidase [Sphingobacteriaceae bacterium]